MVDLRAERKEPGQPKKAPPRKRRRIVVSCTECHRRKQKCDRGLPCANCRSRNRESFCSYDPSAPTSTTSSNNHNFTKVSQPSQTSSISSSSSPRKLAEPLSTMAATWGYGQTGASTISFLKKIEMAPSTEDQTSLSSLSSTHGSRADSFAIREKYKGLIRQLPAKVFTDKLVDMFMREFNWQYYFVDPDIFHTQLQEWNNLPFSIFSTEGPQGISQDLRVFPAVLFQMIATALLILPDEEEEEFAMLKYAANMTFEDLACDYSTSGEDIVMLFGKKGLSVTTVQAEFLRASFLKFTANVTESWHMVGIAIRDAQELGMHRDTLDPKPTDTSLESALENQWLIERRRKLFMVLAIWDVNMCLILGRPGTIDWRHGSPSLPIDAPEPSDRSKTPIVPRNPEKDPPTPLTRSLWLHQLSTPLQDIQGLEQDGPYPKDFSKINKLHQKIMNLYDLTPGIFRVENPDTRWDNDPNVAPWIQVSRYYFHLLHGFSLMALHRLYVFHRKQSRVEALRASLSMLEMQRLMFKGLAATSWRNFMLFFGTFDAIVLIASIYILFPHDHPEHRQLAVQHIHWAIERFATMQARNPLAKSAQGVLRAILGKFTRALSNSASQAKDSETPSFTRGLSETTPASMAGRREISQASSLTTDEYGKDSTSNGHGFESAGTGLTMTGETWLSPSEWAFAPDGLSNIMPTFATSDLIFNDLTAVQDGMDMMEVPGMGVGGVLDWQFGGDIGEGTIWQVLNQFQPR